MYHNTYWLYFINEYENDILKYVDVFKALQNALNQLRTGPHSTICYQIVGTVNENSKHLY
jgi:hypothetical protein